MKGSKREWKPGHWQLRVYVGRNPTGGPVHRYRQFKGGKKASDDALRQFVGEVMGERPELPDDATVSQLLDRWLLHIGDERTLSTMADYRGKIEGRIKPELGSVRLSRLGVQLLDHTYRKWSRDGLAPATVKKLHAILAAACHQAIKWGILASSPTDRATLPRAQVAERGTMTAADIAVIVQDAGALDEGGVLSVAVALAAATGARRGELCGLRWSDYERDAKQLRISRSLTVQKTVWTEGATKTRQTRIVTLGDLSVAVLDWRRGAQEAYAQDVGVQLVEDAFILSRHATGAVPCMPDGLSLGFRRIAMKHEIPYHFHSLRHYTASVGMASGSHARTVADRLGHADPALTLRTYTHGDDKLSRELANSVEDDLSVVVRLPVPVTDEVHDS